jgi:large subunit ribosomal protein L24
MQKMQKMRIRKGDKVQVLTGKDKGKQGNVARAIPSENKVIVEGVHVAKRHAKPTRATMQGGVIDKFMPVSASSVALVCSNCGPTRTGYRVDEQGRKMRVCKKCEADL